MKFVSPEIEIVMVSTDVITASGSATTTEDIGIPLPPDEWE